MNSESLMDAVLKALFLRQSDSPQLSLFDDVPVIEIHRQWDRAADREERSRSRFAQHAIKPDEVARELEKTSAILGDQKVLERFITSACQRMNAPLLSRNGAWVIEPERLPASLALRLPDHFRKFSFEYPAAEGVEYVSRNHPFTNALAEYLFDKSLAPGDQTGLASRLGVIRSKDIASITTLLLLRLRYRVRQGAKQALSVNEECIVAGFEGLAGSQSWLSLDRAERLFEEITPSENLSGGEKEYWAKTVLDGLPKVTNHITDLAHQRAAEHLASYERLRKSLGNPSPREKSAKPTVEPILPADILAVSIIVPQPKG